MANAAEESEKQKSTFIHFSGGINMGIGSFNLVRTMQFKQKYYKKTLNTNNPVLLIPHFFSPQMLSLLPSRVLRLMEFLGFSGDRVGRLNLWLIIIQWINKQ